MASRQKYSSNIAQKLLRKISSKNQTSSLTNKKSDSSKGAGAQEDEHRWEASQSTISEGGSSED